MSGSGYEKAVALVLLYHIMDGYYTSGGYLWYLQIHRFILSFYITLLLVTKSNHRSGCNID